MLTFLRVQAAKLRGFFVRKRADDEFHEELANHLELLTERMIRSGVPAGEAARAARRQLGNATLLQQQQRDGRTLLFLENFLRDLRFSTRQLARHPVFTLTVLFTLALSIGANTAIFSLVNALILKDLPYAQPERMGTIYARYTGPEASNGNANLDGERWELLRDNVPSLTSAVYSGLNSGVNFRSGSRVQYLHAGRISAHYFDVLGVHPFLGRAFSEDEDRPHGAKTVVLSYDFWRTTFVGDPKIVGQAALLKGEAYTVIGVLPEGATTPLNADVYTALQPSRSGEGQGSNFSVITRLREGATWEQADAEINRAWAARIQRFAKSNPGAQVSYYCVPLQKGETGQLRPQVLTLMLAAGFILLIACANLAGLTLVHMLRRTGEIATRLALGASRWQVYRQIWIENLLLALLGGVAGIGVGLIALRGLLLLLPQHFLPVASVPLDARVLAFTFCLSLLTSVLFGMLPALTSRKVDLRTSIASHAAVGGSSLRLRQGLIAGEVALTVVLLASAGLLIRTLIHLETLPTGFDATGVMTAKASLDDATYRDPAAFRKLLDQSIASMRQIPGVQNAAVGLTLPYERTLNDAVTLSDGKEAGTQVQTDELYVTPGYFDTLKIPVLKGRAFSDADGPDVQQVVIVNQSFAQKFFHGADAVGRYLDKNRRIVGVVADMALSSGLSISEPLTSEETIYLPAAQVSKGLLGVHVWFQPSWIVRTAAPVEGLTAQMQRALASADPNLPFSGFYRMEELRAKTLAMQRVEVALLGTLATLALLLSAVGIFALVANTIAQRTRELGIRMALGSTVEQAMLHVGRSGMLASTVGLGVGLVLCAGALRAMDSVLYGVGVYDAPTLVGALLTLFVVAALATALPTLRILRIDPAQTLRQE
ncbi:ABC transporter permease [Terriglobus saanensis]|uniref:Permease n=1 Tax=Terriglobus saanensis (strain ATCC BAA-1853 / DSM 23119 / SP1PR4) TaxID=401053 RepID=E8V035_TERSS|nr:ABC transporter permease [Terriglobus saanensis]ADV82190.1 permease [Terriglobus saanensis SP1PR4]